MFPEISSLFIGNSHPDVFVYTFIKVGVKVNDSYRKSEEVSEWKTHVKEQTENDKMFDTHWGLCQSEEDECV